MHPEVSDLRLPPVAAAPRARVPWSEAALACCSCGLAASCFSLGRNLDPEPCADHHLPPHCQPGHFLTRGCLAASMPQLRRGTLRVIPLLRSGAVV